jgi:DNA recombination protein RmuC
MSVVALMIVSLAALLLLVLVAFLVRCSASRLPLHFDRGVQSLIRETERVDRTVRDETHRVRAELGIALSGLLEARLASLDAAQDTRLAALRDDLARQRTEIGSSFERHAASTGDRIADGVNRQDAALSSFAQRLGQLESSLDGRFEGLRTTVDQKLTLIQGDTAQKLDAIRGTVEEKLQTTLERRLSESFTLVARQLEQVQRGLGEMQSLSEGVGDLRRVMGNVRARGALGEWRLESILEQLLAPDQYARNVRPVPESAAVVEFAIRMPQHGDASSVTWLPVDSKFPVEDYERLIEAQDSGDRDNLEAARRGLGIAVKRAAKDIREKYLSPPQTTEYGILFLPTEGLFAEVVRLPNIVEEVHREHRVMIAGPTTFATLLNCLQMGFRTVALAERSKEVWNLLGAVRTEFARFGTAMTAVKRKLEQAQSAVEGVEVRTRAMERKLRVVDELTAPETNRLFEIGPTGDDELSETSEESAVRAGMPMAS